MTTQQDKIDNLLTISKNHKIFSWEQYSIKEVRMFLEQSVDIINNEENILKTLKPNIFQQNYLEAQKTLKKKIKDVKYERLLEPPKFTLI